MYTFHSCNHDYQENATEISCKMMPSVFALFRNVKRSKSAVPMFAGNRSCVAGPLHRHYGQERAHGHAKGGVLRQVHVHSAGLRVRYLGRPAHVQVP